ncbi:MAG: Asp-tRNA(Asn)/Glu-tRNA(Gln) amidotransferase GatCAB subunit B, partial [Firmicutes bacterium]|nr:Asp-tRNA(Asn)/Glu-tRNA(Gln) amidotransferase GatCAB subunit B [Bacillota bacterium]
ETLAKIVDKILRENPKVVEDYKVGKKKALGYLVGQVMKETKGRANPQLVNKLLKERLR